MNRKPRAEGREALMDPFLPRSEKDTPGWGPEVIVIHPPSFDAVQEAITALQDQATVVVNLSDVCAMNAKPTQLVLGLGLSMGGNVPEIGLRPSLCCTKFERLSISGGKVPEMKLPWIRMSSSASMEPSSGARVPPMHVYSIDQVVSFDKE